MTNHSTKLFTMYSIIFAMLLLLASCSALETTKALPEKPANTEAVIKPILPDTSSLSADLLYDLLVGEIAGQRGDLQQSMLHYQAAAESATDPRVIRRALEIALHAKRPKQALRLAKKWHALAPNNIDVNRFLAILYLKQGDVEHATARFQKIIDLNTEELAKSMLSMVTNLVGKGKKVEISLAVMQQLAKQNSQKHEIWFAYSILATLLKEYTLAETQILHALQINDSKVEYILHYLQLLKRKKASKDFQIKARYYIKKYPKQVLLRKYYGKSLIDTKAFKKAIKQYQQIIKHHSDDFESRYILALVRLDLKQDKQAAKQFNYLLEHKIYPDESHYYLGKIAERNQQEKKALLHYQHITKGDYAHNSKIRQAIIFARTEQLPKALKILQALRKIPQKDSVNLRLFRIEAELLRNAGDYQRAFLLYETAIKVFPNNLDILYEHALMAEKNGDLLILEQDLRKILSHQPDNAQALNALGYTLADRTDRLTEALSFIKKAYQINPSDPGILDSMGWIHYRLGRNELALNFLQKAYKKSADSTIAAHISELLHHLGRHKKAQKILKKALKKAPKNEALLKIKKIIYD